MCLSAAIVVFLLLFTLMKAAEETKDSMKDNSLLPATVNFNEIYTNSLTLLDEPPLTTNSKDEDFHLKSMPTQFVEFHQKPETTPTTPTPPPPMYILNASYLKNEDDSSSSSTTSTTTTSKPIISSTERPEDSLVKVIPIQKNHQRGVLDLLFPASRVKAFKSVFDTFRRILSHTF